jgi:serine/threonine protein kinase
MATMFGRFEIQSELSKSDTALIYKAMDTEANQVVALKTQSLEALGEGAEAFVERLIAEGENTRDLAGQNIVLLYGAGEIDGQFCAAMEYIQGNSVATMLARKEGFSIWDLLDITRQVCAGLEQAAAKGVTHCSLEPAKIMVQWDGMVKILGYGISNMGLIGAESGKGLGRLMPYCSPEQIRGEAIDLRSNLFTLGAILYEMVAGQKAFDGADPVALVSRIENETPASPSAVNSKIHPAVSALIMKALAKNPAERYQSARELLDDLEKCKENGSKKAAPDAKKTASAPKIAVSSADRRAAASKFVSAASSTIDPPAGETKAAAAAASGGGFSGSFSSSSSSNSNFDSSFDSKFDSNSGERQVGDFEISAPESQAAFIPVQSAAAVEQETERQSRRIAVDPMMSEPATGSSGKSFSDLDELPPLKEPVFTPPVPEPAESLLPVAQISPRKEQEEKPKIQPREVAHKAIKEISTVPPRLMIYSILGAVGLILVVAIAIWFHVRSEDDGSTAAPRPAKAVASTPAQPAVQTPVAPQAETPAPAVAPLVEDQPRVTVRQVEKRAPKNSRRAPAPAPVVTLGNALIDSSPQGAQFQVDGKSDPSWVTPFTVASLSPGKHIISASKLGYLSEIRSVDVTAGGTSSVTLQLAPVNALVVVASTPPGAQVVLDGRPTGRVTPAQFAVEKGSHTVLLRKPGYLDEMVTANLGPGQNFQYSPALRALGNADDIRTVGRFKLFGRGGENAAGMGVISIHTQPKGAQIAINQRVLDKLSPVDLLVGPGNYVVDVTLTDFKAVHKVVSVDKGGKVAIDEILERQ